MTAILLTADYYFRDYTLDSYFTDCYHWLYLITGTHHLFGQRLPEHCLSWLLTAITDCTCLVTHTTCLDRDYQSTACPHYWLLSLTILVYWHTPLVWTEITRALLVLITEFWLRTLTVLVYWHTPLVWTEISLALLVLIEALTSLWKTSKIVLFPPIFT